MNRNEEYRRLLEELDTPNGAVEYTLTRAKARLRRRRLLLRPLTALAAVFLCFVTLVNVSEPVAYACAQVPGLRELAEAVKFSRSLTDAVENEYGQSIELTQTDGDVTATVEYLVVDQKQVTVFFRLESEVYDSLNVDPYFMAADGVNHLSSCSYGCNDYNVPNGQLQSVTIDFISGDVPESMRMYLNVWDADLNRQQAMEQIMEAPATAAPESEWDAGNEYREPDYVSRFDFLLEYDPYFTQTGKHIEVNQTVEMDGQRIIIKDVEVYPSHLRVNVEDDPENTAWLKDLDFYIETDKGERFDTVSNGISATGSLDTPMMDSYRADSTYFYEADELKIVITGATWLDKDMETIHVDLASATADVMPESAELAGVERQGSRWVVCIRAKWRIENSFRQIFMNTYYDAEGNSYDIRSWSSALSYGEYEETEGYFFEVFPLNDYPYNEVWLTPAYSHWWTAEEPVTLTITIE